MKKNISFFLITLILFFSLISTTQAQRQLEVDYPRVGDIELLYVEGEGLSEYIIYMVYLLIFVSLLITVISLTRGGLSWLSAKGDPLKIKEGKERITGSIFGIVIILSSITFLSSINPSLIKLEELDVVEIQEEDTPPGIYLSPLSYVPEDINENGEIIHRTTSSIRNLEDINVGSVRISNQLDSRGNILGYYYAIVVHELPAFRGKCSVFVNNDKYPKDFTLPGEISSISVIRVNASPLDIGGVTAYMRPDFNERYPSQPLITQTYNLLPLSINGIWSLDIDGNYGVILASGDNWDTTSNGCGIFLDSKPIPDLKEHHMNKCNERREVPFFAAYESCSTHYAVLPLFR